VKERILLYVQAGGGHPAYALSVPSAAIHGGSTGDISAVGEPTVLSSSLANSVADPDPGYGAFLTPGSGIGKKSIRYPDPESGSGMNTWYHMSESLENFFWVKIRRFFESGCGSGNLFYPGSGMENIRIRDKHPGSATLVAKIGVRSGVLGGCTVDPELFGFFRILIRNRYLFRALYGPLYKDYETQT
jgi:hypothetical protein